MDPHARLPPISGTSDDLNYRLPSISNLVNASKPLGPPQPPPESSFSWHPPISQQRHVKQHVQSLPNSSSTTHHNAALPTTGPELPYAPSASPLEQIRIRGRENHTPREMEPSRGVEFPLKHPWSLPPARDTTTKTYADPSSFHNSAPPSHPSERAVLWSHHSYSARPARASYPSHQNEPPISAPHSSADSIGGSSHNHEILPSFASTFGRPSARPAARISESRQDGPPITVALSREFEVSRPTASYPLDSRRESPILQPDSNSPVNTIGTHVLPIHSTAPSNYTSKPTIQFGVPLDYEFKPIEVPGFSYERTRMQPGRNATIPRQPYPGHHTAGTHDRVISGGQSYPLPSPTSALPCSTSTAASSHAHRYPMGDWVANYNGISDPTMTYRSSVPAPPSRSIHAPPTLPTQPSSRPVLSHLRPYEASIPLGQGAPGLNPVSPWRLSCQP